MFSCLNAMPVLCVCLCLINLPVFCVCCMDLMAESAKAIVKLPGSLRKTSQGLNWPIMYHLFPF